jgi:branched-subunit amino acid transport protein AzlD
MSKIVHDLLLVLIIALVTLGIRALPFLVFPEDQPIPHLVTKLSNLLPAAVMGMLVVYCLRGVTPFAWPFGLPEFIAIAVVVACHIWKRNTLVSIILGTVSYMLLLHFVF